MMAESITDISFPKILNAPVKTHPDQSTLAYEMFSLRIASASAVAVALIDLLNEDEGHSSTEKFMGPRLQQKNFCGSTSWNRDFIALSSVERITAAGRVQSL
jgi:hypothetical protein